MPSWIQNIGRLSILAILVFFYTLHIYFKILFTKIKNLEDRENKIKEDLDEANNLKIYLKKLKDYENIMTNATREVAKILLESKMLQ